MKVFATKQRESLSVVPQPTKNERAAFEVNHSALKQSFRGWIHSVAAMTNEPALPVPAVYRVPRLTALDVSRVNHATIREGESHCIWPPSVLQKFNQADVITSGEVAHYALNDANLTRVEYRKRRQSTAQSAVLQMLAERD
jgi:hypothetical protein